MISEVSLVFTFWRAKNPSLAMKRKRVVEQKNKEKKNSGSEGDERQEKNLMAVLPRDLWVQILLHLPLYHILTFALTCKTAHRFVVPP